MNEGKSHKLDLLAPFLLLLTPLFFLTTTLNFFSTNKQALLIATTLLAMLYYGYDSYKSRSLVQPRTNLNLPLLALVAVVIINLAVNREGQAESIVNRGSLLIALAVITYLTTLTRDAKSLIRKSLSAIIISSSIVGILSILQLLFINTLTSVPVWMQNKIFTPTGAPVIAASLLLTGLVASLTMALKTKEGSQKTLYFVATGITAASLVAYISLMLPGQELYPNFLPHSASWSITLDAFKNPRSTLLGVGLSNFPAIYTLTKPLFLNQTDLWNSLPQSASSELFQTLITMGLLGLAAFGLLIFTTFKNIRGLAKSPESSSLTFLFITLLGLALILPLNIISLTLLFILIALIAVAPKKPSLASITENHHSTTTLHSNMAITVLVTIIAVCAYVGYVGTRVYAGEMHIKRAQDALTRGDGSLVYQEHIQAIQNSPTITSYRISYSQINLRLASAISSGEELSDEDRNNISQLVQQSIREARVATSLRPSLFTTWQNLASIYRNLINVAEGADQFAVENYAQAINRAPANPVLRVEYGGLFYQLASQQEDQATRVQLLNNAIQQFQTAIQLRPSYANAHYNLAKAFELGGNIQQAFRSMQTVVGLIDPTSSDYQTAVTELEELRAKLPADTSTPTETNGQSGEISEPSPLPSPIEGGPIVLPDEEESSPAPSATSPSPTPTPTPTSSPPSDL